MRTALIAFATVVLVSASVAAQAQRGRGATPAGPTNLQVLPKDTPQQDVAALMQQFTQALGVQCTYCHVQGQFEPPPPDDAAAAAPAGRGRRGQGPPPMNYAADDRPQKAVARTMLKLVNDINATLRAKVAKPPSDLVAVQCATCHRGVTNPQPLSDILAQTMRTKGEGAAVATYRDLRQRYGTTQAYDFSEPVLRTLAQEAVAAAKPDDAIAWARLNLEFYPKSVGSYLALADAHTRKRDRSAAIADLEKALEVDPSNVQAKNQLETLKK
jgi:tetratricopeptide (TPR) repeat protein